MQTTQLHEISSACASWMGETWLWVRTEKISSKNVGSNQRKVTIHVLKWAMGAGHIDSYGKNFPGRTFTVILHCKNSTVANSIKNGDTFWVKHHSSDSFYTDRKGNHKRYSYNTWEHLGHSIWPQRPTIVKTLPKGVKLPSSPPAKLLWTLRHSNNITFKVRYKTLGKPLASFSLFNIKETKTVVTLALTYKVSHFPNYYYSTSHKENTRVIQFSATKFGNKIIKIVINGKTLANIKK